MENIINWLMDLSNSKMLGLVIFFITFVGIIIYVYTNKGRTQRLESYKDIPFIDDAAQQPKHDVSVEKNNVER